MITFSTAYPTYKDFQTKIIDVIQTDFPNADWCSYDKMFVSWETIYNFMNRYFNYRQLRYRTQQVHNLIVNEFIDKLPGFHIKQAIFLKDNFSNLFDVKNLGEMVLVNNLIKSSQTQKQIMKNLSASTISPHAFTDALSDMSISDITKTESESDNDSNLTSENDSQGNTKRVNTLDKLIQLADTQFRLYLKELISNFENFFVRFQHLHQQNDDIFLELVNLLKNSQNISWVFDREKVNITANIVGYENEKIKDSIDKKLNSDLSNVDKKKWWKANVSKSSTNQLEVLEDGYYTKSGGGGEIYDGDGKSIVKNDKNIFTAIGVRYQTARGSFFYNGTDIFSRCSAVPQLQASLATVVDLYQNKCVKNDKLKDIVIRDQQWNDNILQIVSRVHIYQTDNGELQVQTDYFYVPPTKGKDLVSNTTVNNQIKLDKDGKMFVEPVNPIVPKDLIDSQDGNQITTGKDKKLYVAQTVLPKWKLIGNRNDWIIDKTNATATLKNKKLNLGSSYFLIISDAIGNQYQKTFFYSKNNKIDTLIVGYGSYGGSIFIYNMRENLMLSFWDKKYDITNFIFLIWEKENTFEPIPPIPPTPHPTKEEQYNAYKEIIKTDGRY